MDAGEESLDAAGLRGAQAIGASSVNVSKATSSQAQGDSEANPVNLIWMPLSRESQPTAGDASVRQSGGGKRTDGGIALTAFWFLLSQEQPMCRRKTSRFR